MANTVSDPAQAQLFALAAEEKFLPQALYSGAKPEPLRLWLQSLVNQLIANLAALPQADRDKDRVLAEFRSTLGSVGHVDSEEREQICCYLERVMVILGIESSDGLLNGWAYGSEVANLLRPGTSEA